MHFPALECRVYACTDCVIINDDPAMLKTIARYLFKSPQPARCATKTDRWMVRSWTVAAIGYHADRQILQIEYSNGFIYEADGVSHDEYTHLREAQAFRPVFRDTILARYQLHRVGYQYPVFLG